MGWTYFGKTRDGSSKWSHRVREGSIEMYLNPEGILSVSFPDKSKTTFTPSTVTDPFSRGIVASFMGLIGRPKTVTLNSYADDSNGQGWERYSAELSSFPIKPADLREKMAADRREGRKFINGPQGPTDRRPEHIINESYHDLEDEPEHSPPVSISSSISNETLIKKAHELMSADPLGSYHILVDAEDQDGVVRARQMLIEEASVEALDVFEGSDEEAAVKVARGLIESNPDRAYNVLFGSGQVDGEDSDLVIARDRFAESDPETAYNVFNENEDEQGLEKARKSWVEEGPEAAFEEFEQRSDEDGLGMVGRKLITIDPEKAYKALMAASVDSDDPDLQAAREGFAKKDPEAAYREFSNFDDESGNTLAIQYWVDQDIDTAFGEFSDSEDLEGLEAAGRKLIGTNPEKSYKALMASEVDDDDEDLEKARQRFAEQDPETAYDEFSGRDDETGLEIARKVWVAQEPLDAFDKFTEDGDGEGLEVVGRKLIGIDPEKAYKALMEAEVDGDDADLVAVTEAFAKADPEVAYDEFSQRDDEEGSTLAIKAWIEEDPVDAFEKFENDGDEKVLEAVGRKLITVDVEKAYRALNQVVKDDDPDLNNARDTLAKENPSRAYDVFTEAGDIEGVKLAINNWVQKQPLQALKKFNDGNNQQGLDVLKEKGII